VTQIAIGTASWTDKTLIACGRFYPKEAKSAEDRLRYYATQFPVVEVDSSYYVEHCVEKMAGHLLAVEFRHESWFDGGRPRPGQCPADGATAGCQAGVKLCSGIFHGGAAS
jgi:uncharacterized protein YecE (DUF72 family)